MSDEPEIRLPPLPLPSLKKIQEIEVWTRSALSDCGFAERAKLDARKAEEVLRTAVIADLDIRLDYYEALPEYDWNWNAEIASHSVASILACFPSNRYEKQSGEATIEYEGSYQFLAELIRTGWDHMVNRRIATGKKNAPPHAEAKAPRVEQAEIERRAALLAEYKAATGNPSDMRIYQASHSGIHKPEFQKWRNGILPVESATTQNLERFLTAKKRPIPRPKKPKK